MGSTVGYLRLKMRSLAVFLAVIGVSLASQVTFLKFAKTFQKSYGSTEEYNKRMEIFLQNYNDILRHNQLYEEGKVTWWRKITEYSDLGDGLRGERLHQDQERNWTLWYWNAARHSALLLIIIPDTTSQILYILITMATFSCFSFLY